MRWRAALKAAHPFGDSSRIWAQLHFVVGLVVNKKHILWVLRHNQWVVKPNPTVGGQTESQAESHADPVLEQAPPHGTESVGGIDLTKGTVEHIGWSPSTRPSIGSSHREAMSLACRAGETMDTSPLLWLS